MPVSIHQDGYLYYKCVQYVASYFYSYRKSESVMLSFTLLGAVLHSGAQDASEINAGVNAF